ncbi:MAG TPA: class I SAM-dependent methyltransferase [Blastocatellia bacterium]|nr:class I SAM-dependent methyltransferase [Blastocatellia bacterium]
MESDNPTIRDAKELAYLYDLYVAPTWSEAFDQMVDDEIELPREGRFLEVGCGTGSYAIDLAIRGGANTEVVGVDPSLERLALARGKAEVKKLERVEFRQGAMRSLELPDDEFDLVIGDASMSAPSEIGPALAELKRVARKGATVVLKLTTRGSFDEFFSIYWESLYNLGLLDYAPQLEALITERLTVSDAEELANGAGLKDVRAVTSKERFDYKDGKEFFESPLIGTFFLDDWLAILPDEETRRKVQQQMMKIIDEERHKMDFDVSIKATLIIGQK